MDFWSNIIWGRLANYVTAFFSALLLLFNVVQVDKKPQTLSIEGMKLVFEDDFNGDQLNAEYWQSHGEGLRKGGYWTLEQAFVKDGNLVIRTEYKSDGKFGAGWYTSGIQATKAYEFTYGYYECRCILPKGQGLWSAFWLMNNDVGQKIGSGVEGTEIDVFESPYYFLGGRNAWKVTSNLHYNGYEIDTKYQNICISALDNDPYENYNTYGLLWAPDGYTVYINGHEVGKSNFGGVSKKPEHMILSCEVDGAAATPTFGWSGTMDKNDKETFSADFTVDYVRVYQNIL